MLEISKFLSEINATKPEAEDEKLIQISYILCKTFGWDYYTLIKQPIPFVLSLLYGLMEESKETDKTMKNLKNKGKR